MPLVHTTAGGVQIHAEPGKKSQYDFKVRFRAPHKRIRTPKHVHLIVELYVKHAFNPALTNQLRDYLIHMYHQLQPVGQFPPTLQVYKPNDEAPFLPLDAVGEFSVEFFLVANELIFIQEKTNYPTGSQTEKLYEAFGVKDMFYVINEACYRGSA